MAVATDDDERRLSTTKRDPCRIFEQFNAESYFPLSIRIPRVPVSWLKALRDSPLPVDMEDEFAVRRHIRGENPGGRVLSNFVPPFNILRKNYGDSMYHLEPTVSHSTRI